MCPNSNDHDSCLPGSSDPDEQLAEVLVHLSDRVLLGETIDIEQECERYPSLAAELRELWGALLVADALSTDGSSSDSESTVEAPMAQLSLPSRMGDFELLEELGRGGMGVVFLARQVSLDRRLAVKMILRGQLASAGDRQRFLVEAQAAARLDHPGIVPVYQVGEEGGHMYFSMKYIRGHTLADRLGNGPLPSRDAARIMIQVSRAIGFAHQQGVLHRDLKPSNILIDTDQQPHVSDFGLAKRDADAHDLTRPGAIIGTPAYMAPEQASGRGEFAGPASDVYSLGAILYHLITGEPPLHAATPVDLVMKVIEQDPSPPRQVNSKIDRDLELITVRCLQKPPDLRYRTANELADDLEAYINNEPIRARSGRLSQIVARWFRETHHATVLENWGLLWMWHSLALLVACLLTNVLYWCGNENRLYYFSLWTAGFGTWVIVFWVLRRRMGPVTFVERQIAHVWAAALLGIVALFPLEAYLGLEPLQLSPVLGLIAGMMFLVKAGILSGLFYVPAVLMFVTAGLMAVFPTFAHSIFGLISAGCFFFPGLKYYRQRGANIPESTGASNE